MEFCKICGNVLTRQIDGKLSCRDGHVLADDKTVAIQKAKREREQERQKELLTFPDPEKGIVVCRLDNPYHGTEKSKLPFPHGNADSFKVYRQLREMEKTFGPEKFKYLRGDPFGTTENKVGIILVSPELLQTVKSRIETIQINDGGGERSNYTVEIMNVSTLKLKERIEAARDEMRKRLNIAVSI